MSLILAMLAVGLGDTNPGEGNPLAPAKEGRMQCYRPNPVEKTCQSIASYRRTGPATYDNKAVIPVAGNASLETHTPVTIKGGAVCGPVRASDILAGTLRVGGQALPATKARPMLERIAGAMAALTGKEICTRYDPSGDEFVARVTVGGRYDADQDVKVRWIDPAEGYIVAP